MDFLDTVVMITNVCVFIIFISTIVWIKAQPHMCQDRSEGASFDVGSLLCPPCLKAFFLHEMTREVAKTVFRCLILLFLIRAFGMAYFYNQFNVNSIRMAFYSYVISAVISCDQSRLLHFLHRWGLTFCASGYIIVFTFQNYMNIHIFMTMISVGILGVILVVNTSWMSRLELLPIVETSEPTTVQE